VYLLLDHWASCRLHRDWPQECTVTLCLSGFWWPQLSATCWRR